MIAEAVLKKDKKIKQDKQYTLEEYFELEEKAPYKNEFVNGEIIPMAGGTINHGVIGGAIHALLFMLFLDSEKEISIYSNDQKIYIPDYHKVTYTDTCAVVGKTKVYKEGNQAILNPSLIIEVASKSTEKYDRTTKFRMYRSLPSFQEYVIVNQNMPIIEVFYKINENQWRMTPYVGLDQVIELETLGISLKMSDIYSKAINIQDPQTAMEFPEEDKV